VVKLELSAAVLEEIYVHADSGYPEEVVGFVVGPLEAPAGDEVRRCLNLQSTEKARAIVPGRSAERAYELGPKDQLFLARSERAARQVKIIYHSHPDVGAYFSGTDREVALMGGDEPAYGWVQYLVVDAQKDGARGCKLFAWDPAHHGGQGEFVCVFEHHRGGTAAP
jgi:adenylyltransferase/sulfurtransferase